jgi:hypothetical protein
MLLLLLLSLSLLLSLLVWRMKLSQQRFASTPHSPYPL